MPCMSRESRESLNSLLARLKRTGTHCPWRPTKPDTTLIEHLEILEIPELENRLIFISPNRLKNIELHAQGGFAKVYRARISWQCMPGSRPSATYALKELKEGMISELVMNVLMDDALLPVHAITKHPETGQYLMVMPLAKGGTLESRLSNSTNDWEGIARQAQDLAKCLAKIHKRGFLHNDLHPGNIVYLWRDDPRIIDIGLGSSIDEANQFSGTCGRVKYLPPELLEGGSERRTQATDVYSFATLLWQMVTGVPPRGDSPTAVKSNPDCLREELIPGAPVAFNNVLRDCWNPDPNKRPTMDKVHRRLQSWSDEVRKEWMTGKFHKNSISKTLFTPDTLGFIAQRQAEREPSDNSTGASSLVSPSESPLPR